MEHASPQGELASCQSGHPGRSQWGRSPGHRRVRRAWEQRSALVAKRRAGFPMNRDLSILILLAEDLKALARLRTICPGAHIHVGPWITDAKQTLPREMLQGVDVLF